MAYSYIRYTGDGSTKNYTFTFPYLDSSHIKVRLNGTLTTLFTFLNASTIQLTSAPAGGVVIEIRRETPKDSPIVNFTDGSVLLEKDLDLMVAYDLYIAQETDDISKSSISQDSTGVYQALNKRIVNVADPVDAQDAVTKTWAETGMTSQLVIATAQASTATSQAASATTSASAAAASAATAATKAGEASSSATTAATQATTATTQATTATTKATAAAASATAAATSATAAANSATDAASYQTSVHADAITASAGATTATTKASDALGYANSANTAATTATSQATAAATSATSASSSATTAGSSASSAANSASVANSAAGNASTSATAAGTSANNASTSATNAATSATNASLSAANSLANRDAAAASSTLAGNSASAAATSATNAASSATSASTSAAAASAVALGNEPVRHSVRPSLLLDFANTKQLDPRITFSRPTTATYYDGKTTVKAEENLIVNSQVFTGWSVVSASATSNTTTAPDGTTTASTLAATATGTNTNIYYTIASPIGSTISIYAKANTATFFSVSYNTAGSTYANFNLSAGTVASSAGCTATITSVGSGWYRCILSNIIAAGVYVVVHPKDSDPAAHPWNNGTTTSGNSVYLWGAQLEQRSSVTAYTATTTAPITNYIPKLLTQQSNEARFDNNPTTGESLGLLIEEQRTNLVTYSQDFSNAVWANNNLTVTANTVVSPDGTITAESITETTANGEHNLGFSIGTTSFEAAVSCYMKKGTGRYGLIRFGTVTAGGYRNAIFDLQDGIVVSVGTGITASMQSVGNGWYRCIAQGNKNATNSFALFGLSDGTTNSYIGNGYSTIYIWGAQLEAGAFATSYIPTTTSQVTRSADSASMTGANFSSWYRADAWTMYSEAMDRNGIIAGTNFSIYSISDTTANNETITRFLGSNTVTQSYGSNGGAANQWVFSGTATSAGTYKKLATAYAINDVAFSDSGATVSTDSSALLISNMTQLLIGGERSATQSLNGTIKKLAYYPKRLTNAELQGLTTV